MIDASRHIDSIEDAIVQHMQSDDDGFHTFEIGEYYPHILGKCPLRYYYVYLSEEKPHLEGKSLNYVTVGKIAHTMIQSALAKAGYEIEKEFTLDFDGFRVRGRADAVYLGLPTHVVEIKTTREFPHEVYHDHVLQAHVYMKAFNADYTIFIYVRRYDFARKYFVVPFEEKYWKEAFDWFSALHKSLVSGRPPSPNPAGYYECDTCPYRDKCPRMRDITSYF